MAAAIGAALLAGMSHVVSGRGQSDAAPSRRARRRPVQRLSASQNADIAAWNLAIEAKNRDKKRAKFERICGL